MGLAWVEMEVGGVVRVELELGFVAGRGWRWRRERMRETLRPRSRSGEREDDDPSLDDPDPRHPALLGDRSRLARYPLDRLPGRPDRKKPAGPLVHRPGRLADEQGSWEHELEAGVEPKWAEWDGMMEDR